MMRRGSPQPSPPHSAADLVDLLSATFDEYPMGDGPKTTIALTGPDGKIYEAKPDPEQLGWLGNQIVSGHADADRSRYDHPDHGVCAHCEQDEDTVQR